MAPVTGLRAGAVRLAVLAPHRVQRPPPEVACLRDQGEQLSAAAVEPRHVTPGAARQPSGPVRSRRRSTFWSMNPDTAVADPDALAAELGSRVEEATKCLE